VTDACSHPPVFTEPDLEPLFHPQHSRRNPHIQSPQQLEISDTVSTHHSAKMRLPVLFLLALFTAVFALPPPQKPVIVSFPDNTPSSVIDKAIAEIEKDGGIITHEYCMSSVWPFDVGTTSD
jgi:hypothetical protein